LDLFFSASLLWGAISPKRLFEERSIYHFLPYCFVIGIFLPIPFYVLYRHYPPFGTMCKGNSWFFFLPDCACPTASTEAGERSSGEQQQQEGVGVGVGGGQTQLEDVDGDLAGPESAESKLSKNLEAGHTGCWPFGHRSTATASIRSKTGEDKILSDKSAAAIESNGTTLQPHRLSKLKKQQPPPPPPPHTYYGHPDNVWDNRLRRVPWHLVNTPLICVGASFVPQAPASFVTSAGIVAFCFAFLVLRFRHEWWRRYTFVLAAALDAGTQICNMAIFVVFSLILKGAITFPGWLGNDTANPEKCGVGDGYN